MPSKDKLKEAVKQARGYGDKYSRIFAMGDEKVKALDGYLLQGLSANRVAQIVQSEWGFFTDVMPATLAKQISRYYDNVVSPRIKASVQEPDSEEAKEALKSVAATNKTHIDVLEKLELAVTIQERRILKLYEREKNLPNGMHLTALSAEWKSYLTMLKTLGEFQMDMGIVRRAPKLVGVGVGSAGEMGGAELEAALGASVPESEFSAILALLGKEAPIEGQSSRVEPERK